MPTVFESNNRFYLTNNKKNYHNIADGAIYI